MTNRTHIADLKNFIGRQVTIAGWVDVRRDQGKMIFIDMRDVTGKIQCVVLPNHAEAIEKVKEIRNEWVLKIIGVINKRPEKNIKDGAINGDIELEVIDIDVLNKAETPAIDLSTDGYEIGEEHRLEHRYLDLRRTRMQKNIRNRHKVVKFIRDYLDKENFIEIETPILSKSTAEGARDFIVPSRLDQGKFYALPQAPQQYKQLLMASGMEKYFQMAKCMRDEDLRGDRQPEFTQLDMEMSFVDREEVISLNENLLIEIVQKLYPEKEIQEIPFPKIPYKDAIEKYGTDRPDIRKDKENKNLLAFCWVIDFPFFEKANDENNPQAEGEWTFTHNPFSAAQPQFHDDLLNKRNISNILTNQYDIVLNGYEIGGGSIRNHEPEALLAVYDIMGVKKEEVEKNLFYMLDAFRSGTPPHGGIAWGFDRLMMILENEPNIREVIAFPKNGEGKDLMMKSPSITSDKQLKELGLNINKK
ncbi:MAG TPA: amino acid--tRNA ligase-related protein [Candidatus Paceibacterota bacterium]|nr:amino acid--tRNA ligase-related protein [Candidatus Paceibacterota bacterium]